MLGNPFSPRWASARRAAAVRATSGPSAGALAPTWRDYCAVNVALRHRGTSRWVMTEHARSSVSRGPDHLVIGGSEVEWRSADRLEIRVRELESPWRRRVVGTVRLVPLAAPGPVVVLDGEGRHVWRAQAPFAQVEVDFDEPRVRFRGHGYLDGNQGARPLEEDFTSWAWSRVADRDRAEIGYDVLLRDGTEHRRGVVLARDGGARAYDEGVSVDLGTTRFGLPRAMRCSRAAGTRALDVVEDGPFYARSIVETSLGASGRVLGMHEVVSLDRFRARWVQTLVPFRMRVAGP